MPEKISPSNDTSRAPVSQRGHKVQIPGDTEAIGAKVTVTIDGQDVRVPFGTRILEAARKVNVRIPTLCSHEDLCIAGLCRICAVEVEGWPTLQPACAYPLTSPIKIHTLTPKVRESRRRIIDLLLSKHHGECDASSPNHGCELHALAKEYGVDSFNYGRPDEPIYEIDRSSDHLVLDMNKCVLCRRCVRTCIDLQEVGTIEVVSRSDRMHIGGFMDKPLSEVVCINCGQCISRCPTGALSARDSIEEIHKEIDAPDKHVVILTAPAPRAGIGECFGLEPGVPLTGELNTALRTIGFDAVFNADFAADLTIIEEGTELILRLYQALVERKLVALPQFTSCSPGWVKYLEHFYPDMLQNLSSAKSPQQMFGAIIKTYFAKLRDIDPARIITVSLVPCPAKKFECDRPEMRDSGFKDIDYGLTARELAQMVKGAGIDLPRMPKSGFDDPFGGPTGSGVISAATGGVMEAALRTVIELVTGIKAEEIFEQMRIMPVRGFEGVRYAEIKVPRISSAVPGLLNTNRALPFNDFKWLEGMTLKVAVAHGTANAKRVLEDIKAGGKFSECHFIEFMACPGGCLGGGGMPIPTSPEIRAARAEAIYAEEESCAVRKSHDNPAVVKLYSEFLTDGPCGHKSHELLHTHYTARGKYIA